MPARPATEGGGRSAQDGVRTGMITWTYDGVVDGLEDAGRERPCQLDRELGVVHVLERLEQVARVERDRHGVALELGLDLALGVADVGGGGDRSRRPSRPRRSAASRRWRPTRR